MMERPKTFFDYIAQTLMTFGLTVAVFLLLTLFLGNAAQEVSTLFSLGEKGVSVASLAQLLLLCACIVFFRFLFFTETIIRKAGVAARTVAMLFCTVVLILLFVIAFRWFPAKMPLAWVSFGVCFVVCFLLGALVSSCKERLENRKMADALEKMKNRGK